MTLAAGNSVSEELFWRLIALGTLRRYLSVGAAVAIQAIAFGALHWRGFPSGFTGVALTALFGAGAGWEQVP